MVINVNNFPRGRWELRQLNFPFLTDLEPHCKYHHLMHDDLESFMRDMKFSYFKIDEMRPNLALHVAPSVLIIDSPFSCFLDLSSSFVFVIIFEFEK